MARLDGRCALVTGSAAGIGAATARRLAADGARVAVLDLDEERTQETVHSIVEAGGSAIGLGADVRDRAQVEAAFARIDESYGGVDVLVNNAGVIRDNLLFKMTDEDWELVIDVHLKGSFFCVRAAQAHMVEQRWGKIVNISSTSAMGNRGQTNYSTAKAGLQGMTKTLAVELGPFNINANCVAPGFIETAMTRATSERMGVEFEQHKRASSERIPLRRVGRPEDIANVVAFLSSDEASYVSGQVIYVNGGSR